MSKNVFLIDSQYLTKLSISAVVERMYGISISKILNYPHELLPEINDSQIDILITEYTDVCPSEIDYILKISNTLKIPTLVVTNSSNHDVIQQLIKSEIKGVITKNCSQEEIELAINSVVMEKRFYCNNVLDLVIGNQSANQKKDLPQHDLSSRELEVLELIANGLTTKHIADQLHLSVHTINSHRKNILKKLNITSPAHLAAFAIENGLVKMFD